jgi:hypothetical protein
VQGSLREEDGHVGQAAATVQRRKADTHLGATVAGATMASSEAPLANHWADQLRGGDTREFLSFLTDTQRA